MSSESAENATETTNNDNENIETKIDDTSKNENNQPEYTLETLEDNSSSSINSSHLNLDSNEDFLTSNENNISNCGLSNRDGYTVLSPLLSPPPMFSTPVPSRKSSIISSTYNLNSNPILTSLPTVNNPFNENQQVCLECGAYAVLQKCKAHCNLDICENCKQNHWQIEVDDLLKMKTHLENNIADLKGYLGAKKAQCNENVRSSQQIKRFINMTMNQIKRKIELELENKRDELFSSVESFCDNQKKLGTSVNEDSFQSAERVCDEIENLLLNTENNVNLIKVNSLKTYSRSCTQKMNQQKNSRMPLYSIFFVPDSSIQINNNFGKIVLKSFNPEQGAENTTTLDDGETFDESYFQPSPQPISEPFSYEPQQPLHAYQPQPQYQPKTQYQHIQLQAQPAPQAQIVTPRPIPTLNFTPKYNPLKTQNSAPIPQPLTVNTDTYVDQNNMSDMDYKRAQYQNKYYSQKSAPQGNGQPKSGSGSFMSRRTTNVYANQMTNNNYNSLNMNMSNGDHDFRPNNDIQVPINISSPIINEDIDIPPLPLNSPPIKPLISYIRPEITEITDIIKDDPFFDVNDDQEPKTFSYVSESEDGDLLNSTNYTDITISNVSSKDDNNFTIGDDSPRNIDRGVFEDVFTRSPTKIQDLRLEKNTLRPILQTPSDSNGIREIKVVHKGPKMNQNNGFKRFSNFQNQNSIGSSFEKSEMTASSGSDSGSSQNSSHVLQKSFKQQLILNKQSHSMQQQSSNNVTKLVNS